MLPSYTDFVLIDFGSQPFFVSVQQFFLFVSHSNDRKLVYKENNLKDFYKSISHAAMKLNFSFCYFAVALLFFVNLMQSSWANDANLANLDIDNITSALNLNDKNDTTKVALPKILGNNPLTNLVRRFWG